MSKKLTYEEKVLERLSLPAWYSCGDQPIATGFVDPGTVFDFLEKEKVSLYHKCSQYLGYSAFWKVGDISVQGVCVAKFVRLKQTAGKKKFGYVILVGKELKLADWLESVIENE